jgi:hypothetical protein
MARDGLRVAIRLSPRAKADRLIAVAAAAKALVRPFSGGAETGALTTLPVW